MSPEGFSSTPRILSDLPTEILCKIFEGFTVYNLFNVSLVSRRLHYVALPLYFSRLGLSDTLCPSPTIVLQKNSLKALPGLQVSTFITSVKKLSCTFCPPGRVLLKDMARLIDFIDRVSHIEEVVFDFADFDYWVSICPGFTDLPSPEVIASALDKLLAIALGKSCSNLSIQRGADFMTMSIRTHSRLERQRSLIDDLAQKDLQQPRNLQNPRKLKGIRRKVFNLFRLKPPAEPPSSDSSEPEHQTPVVMHLDAIKSTQLQTLEIHSPLLLGPHFIDLTTKILMKSYLTFLSFRHYGGQVEMENIISLMDRIRIPTLLHLGFFAASNAEPSHLMNFISRHPTLESLDLGDTDFTGENFDLAGTVMPRTTKLCARHEYVHLLLSHPHFMPNLRSVTIVWPCMDRVTGSAIQSKFLAAATRLQKLSYISYKLIIITDPSRWVSLPCDSASRGQGSTLQRVENLQVASARRKFSRNAMKSVSLWIQRMPALRHLSFTSTHGYEPIIKANDDDALARLRSVVTVCSQLTTISIDGKVVYTKGTSTA